ncbi:MAG: hypothetical protein ABI559_08370, partial [Chloroflexota bacterium]
AWAPARAEVPEVVAEIAPPVVARAPELIAEVAPEIVAGAPQVLAAPVETYAGDEERVREEPIAQPEAAVVEAAAPVVDPAAGMPQPEKYNEFDIALEVERLLKNRKWESREGPFRGFKSPPGRF